MVEKVIYIDHRAKKELASFPREIQVRIKALLKLLGELGSLESPTVKKLQHGLFELRIQKSGSWRVLFCYLEQGVVILTAFNKKTNKTPQKEITKAIRRMKEYLL